MDLKTTPFGETKPSPGADIPVPVWLGISTVLLLGIVAAQSLGEQFYERWFYGETGLVELLTVVFSISASLFAFGAWRHRGRLPTPYLGWWLLIFAVGAFFFAGEEASWGQHFLGWSTPDAFRAFNDHGETNLHNITNWADEKPKHLVEFASMIGGVALPIFIRLRGIRLDPETDWRYWFVPTIAVVPGCLYGAALKSIERIRDGFDWYPEGFLGMRMSEPQEMFFGLFFMIYAWSFHRRIRRLNDEVGTPLKT